MTKKYCKRGVTDLWLRYQNDEVLHSKTNNFWLRIFDNKSIEFLLDVSTGSFLLLKEMQSI
jgi:hypothetical protein